MNVKPFMTTECVSTKLFYWNKSIHTAINMCTARTGSSSLSDGYGCCDLFFIPLLTATREIHLLH